MHLTSGSFRRETEARRPGAEIAGLRKTATQVLRGPGRRPSQGIALVGSRLQQSWERAHAGMKLLQSPSQQHPKQPLGFPSWEERFLTYNGPK